VCGTDLHLTLEGWGRPGSIGGHEYSGRIVALGAEVEGWSVGDAAVGGPEPGCGACRPCAAGRPSLCVRHRSGDLDGFQGAFAQFTRVAASRLVRVPEGLALREAALCEPLAVALHGIQVSRVRPGQRALVAGAGPIGMLTLAALRARGVDDVIVSEPSPRRRELAERVGARRALPPESLARPRMPFDLVDEPVDVAFECSGRAAAFRSALEQLDRTGTLVVLGSGMERPKLDPNRILLNELVVTGSYNYDAGGFDAAIALLAGGRLPIGLLIEAQDVDLEGLLGAMQGLAAGQIAGKVMVAPN
jgi:(R,R)-butanediol dehydrogenase/meso-butanediol dehydrogenase/diacetyl reductase